ncbi:hypothetical protein [uncultured Endozoicomonas sp.]|uniref:hypothetical protein n=1 Tax=uncultured Endozoicomonas sp. TaxID=432652 RepID=UPI00260C6ADB|nr:hypothetical protein [uncultured Endozoicomonas sp.]
MKKNIIHIFSWICVVWIAKVFLLSLPYKFSNHPDTQHIFDTIGLWMKKVLSENIGNWFISHGAVTVGTTELIVSLILLTPALFYIGNKLFNIRLPFNTSFFHACGGLAASAVMAGAVFFHLFTPLGIVVLHEGKSDGGSLFYAAASILVLGFIMSVSNFYLLWSSQKNDCHAI